MTAYIEKLETERGGNRLGGPRCAEDGDTTLYELKRKYHMLCQAFINLYSSPPAMDLFEIVNGNLVDHSSRGQVVVEGDLIEPIVDRLKNIDKKKLKI